jgi:hypothetical protein
MLRSVVFDHAAVRRRAADSPVSSSRLTIVFGSHTVGTFEREHRFGRDQLDSGHLPIQALTITRCRCSRTERQA